MTMMGGRAEKRCDPKLGNGSKWQGGGSMFSMREGSADLLARAGALCLEQVDQG